MRARTMVISMDCAMDCGKSKPRLIGSKQVHPTRHSGVVNRAKSPGPKPKRVRKKTETQMYSQRVSIYNSHVFEFLYLLI